MEHTLLRVEQEAVAGAAVLTVTGELDLDSAPVLARALTEAAQSIPRAVIADVGAMTFMDSSGINALLRAHHDLTAHGSRLALVNPVHDVERILAITGVNSVIPVYPAVSQALHA